MKIKTKYNVGQKVWFFHNSLPVESDIKTITVYTNGSDFITKYYFGEYGFKYESELSKFKQTLLKDKLSHKISKLLNEFKR